MSVDRVKACPVSTAMIGFWVVFRWFQAPHEAILARSPQFPFREPEESEECRFRLSSPSSSPSNRQLALYQSTFIHLNSFLCCFRYYLLSPFFSSTTQNINFSSIPEEFLSRFLVRYRSGAIKGENRIVLADRVSRLNRWPRLYYTFIMRENCSGEEEESYVIKKLFSPRGYRVMRLHCARCPNDVSALHASSG